MTPKIIYATALQIYAESIINGFVERDENTDIDEEIKENTFDNWSMSWEDWDSISKSDKQIIENEWGKLSEEHRIKYLDLALKFLQAKAIIGG